MRATSFYSNQRPLHRTCGLSFVTFFFFVADARREECFSPRRVPEEEMIDAHDPSLVHFFACTSHHTTLLSKMLLNQIFSRRQE